VGGAYSVIPEWCITLPARPARSMSDPFNDLREIA
jgi:hypothetical protein